MNAVNLNAQHWNISWLDALRAKALEQFQGSGFPSPRAEDWRYSNVAAIEKKQFQPGSAAVVDVDPKQLSAYKIDGAHTVVLVDGLFRPELSDAISGVAFKPLAKALAADAAAADYLGQAQNQADHGFIHYNTAAFTDGLYLKLSQGQTLDRPIQVLNWVSQEKALVATRNLIIVGADVNASIIETFAGDDVAYLSCHVTEVFAGPGSQVRLSKIQQQSTKSYHFGGLYCRQQANAQLRHDQFAFGAAFARTDIYADLAEAAECVLNGLYVGGDKQVLDTLTRIHHRGRNSVSRELYKGVLADTARGAFQGRIVVAQGADGTDSQMNNRNLLLSDNAEADTKPQLEIYADDVKCSHGVTVGQLDDKSLFYLKSRAVDEDSARNMLTFAFANEMIGRIDHSGTHALLLKALLERFPQHKVPVDWL